jgi:hypothetical protein
MMIPRNDQIRFYEQHLMQANLHQLERDLQTIEWDADIYTKLDGLRQRLERIERRIAG